MKKRISLLLISAMLLTMVGCHSTEEKSAAGEPESTPPIFEQTYFGLPFQARYVRTNSYAEGILYPTVRPIFSAEELDSYYHAQRQYFDLDRATESSGFLDACSSYDEAFFAENYLLLVVLQESSGSISHEVSGVNADIADQRMEVEIRRIVPEVGTDDMAQWHIILELQRRSDVQAGENVKIYLDGELSYDGEPLVPPQVYNDMHEPPTLTLVTPEEESCIQPSGFSWTYRGDDGTATTIIADQASRPVLKDSLYPIVIPKSYAETVYLPVPGTQEYAPTNSLGYPVKLYWEVPPSQVTWTCWKDTVWDGDDPGEAAPQELGELFYVNQGSYIYEFTATWEDMGSGGYGTAAYYAYFTDEEAPCTEPIGYCGNTQTTIHLGDRDYTFMYGYSVTLTDMLLRLDYDPIRVCRCRPEFTVDTEFGTGYGINLSEGYARCDQGQADLTQAQIDTIREILEWAETTNCQYPIDQYLMID